MWEFFITEETKNEIEKIINQSEEKGTHNHLDNLERKKRARESTSRQTYGAEYNQIRRMSLTEREGNIGSNVERVNEALDTPQTSLKMSQIMANATLSTTLINKISIDELIQVPDRESQQSLEIITKKSQELMASYLKVLSKDYNLNHTTEAIMGLTEGVTARHMVRVFILSIRFLDYIRLQFETAGLYKRLQPRINTYFPLYEPLMDRFKFNRFSPEMILPQIPKFTDEHMTEVMLGVLLHDLGKKKNLQYFDGSDDYNRKIIEDHAFSGYLMLMKKTVYKQSIASVAGLHHEYYGHPKGYGVFRDNYTNFTEKRRDHAFDSVLTNEYNDISNFKAVAYLPAKILEIVDVYDAMGDKDRQYKEALTPLETLKFMRKEMIINSLELDPILFDLFVKFMNQAKLI